MYTLTTPYSQSSRLNGVIEGANTSPLGPLHTRGWTGCPIWAKESPYGYIPMGIRVPNRVPKGVPKGVLIAPDPPKGVILPFRAKRASTIHSRIWTTFKKGRNKALYRTSRARAYQETLRGLGRGIKRGPQDQGSGGGSPGGPKQDPIQRAPESLCVWLHTRVLSMLHPFYVQGGNIPPLHVLVHTRACTCKEVY